MAVTRHTDSWVELQHLGASKPYRATYEASLELGATHRRLLEAPRKPGSVTIDIGIPGWLRREDAAKLYELAYFASGDVLELGCARGLSTAIIAQAIIDAGRKARVLSVDLDPRMVNRARENLAAYNLLSDVEFVQGDAAVACRALVDDERTFGFAFVDHSHTYADVFAVCKLLRDLVDEGGFVLFHDFNDRRNADQSNAGYGVYTGVMDGLPVPPFAFYGVFGCAGLYRHESSRAPALRRSGEGLR